MNTKNLTLAEQWAFIHEQQRQIDLKDSKAYYDLIKYESAKCREKTRFYKFILSRYLEEVDRGFDKDIYLGRDVTVDATQNYPADILDKTAKNTYENFIDEKTPAWFHENFNEIFRYAQEIRLNTKFSIVSIQHSVSASEHKTFCEEYNNLYDVDISNLDYRAGKYYV